MQLRPLSRMRILCSLSYPIIEIVAACLVGLVGRLASNDDDFPGFVDFHPRNTHTRSGYALDGSGQVALAKSGLAAGHDAPPPLALRRPGKLRRIVRMLSVVDLPWCRL